VLARAPLPGELRCALESARTELRRVLERGEDSRRDAALRARIDEDPGAVQQLLDRMPPGGGDRAPARHCLEHGPAESLVEAREDQYGRAAVEPCQLLGRKDPERARSLRQWMMVPAAAGEVELEPGPGPAHDRKRGEEQAVVLVRPAAGGIEEERLAVVVPGPEEPVVDSVLDDPDRFAIEPEPRDGALPDELAGNDHTVGVPGGSVIQHTAAGAHGPRHQLGMVEVQHVVKRHDVRSPRRGERDGERVVNDLGAGQCSARGRRACERRCAPTRGARSRNPHGQSSARILRVGRHDGDVVERSGPCERRGEPSRVALRPPHATRRKGEQAQGDHGRILPDSLARDAAAMLVIDLAVLGQDPRFGGGGEAQTRAFIEGASALGREPKLVYEPHPGLGSRRPSVDRVEALHQLRVARRLATQARSSRSLWVVATMAANGGAASRAGRAYSCWIGTSIESEWRGRSPGLGLAHRLAAGMSLPVLRRLERVVLRGAARLYATSASSRAAIAAAAGVDEATIGLLPIPVDTEHFFPEPDADWRRTLASPVVAFVGRGDDPRKNVRLLLDAARLLPEVRVRLIGSPPRAALPNNVEALGFVPDVREALRGATLFVLPSLQEGFGIVAAEALAAGLPVVTTPSGGPEELVRRSGGGVVLDGFGADELASSILELLDDPAQTMRVRSAGRSYVEREHSQARFRELLDEALRD
jgi:glycosyltransferase involved in cell wall biosynthesis